MKKRRSFFKRHIIAIMILILVAGYSVRSTLEKQTLYDALQESGKNYDEKIAILEKELRDLEEKLENVDTLEFVEQYARETLKMVSPNEIYFEISFPDPDKNQE